MICEVIKNGPEYCLDCVVCKRERQDTTKCISCGEEVLTSTCVNNQCEVCYAYELEYINKYID